jgi:hypothetical protein
LRDAGKLVQEFFRKPLTTNKVAMEKELSGKTTATAALIVRWHRQIAPANLGTNSRVLSSKAWKNVLAWHYDRAFPYGGRNPDAVKSNSTEEYIALAAVSLLAHPTTMSVCVEHPFSLCGWNVPT